MNALDEAGIRAELHRAVDGLDPLPPPFASVMARGRRRRRTRWLVGGLALTTAVAATVVAVVVIAPGGAGNQQISPAVKPPPLRSYARHNGGVPVKKQSSALDWVAGPVKTPTGRYGGFVTEKDLVVVKLVHGQWHTEASLPLGEGPPSFRLGVEVGPTLPSGVPTFLARGEGGDVTYFGAVGADIGGTWRFAHFGPCGKAGCGATTDAVSYLRMTGHGLVSAQNNCTPDCASGTEYRISWRWTPSRSRFDAISVTPTHP